MFRIEYTYEAEAHFDWLTARQRSTVLDRVERQLAFEPQVETRNRKRLDPNPIAPWELRVGTVRVFYDVATQREPVVRVAAVGVKRGNIVWIAGIPYDFSGTHNEDD